ncbi:MAG: immunoglobulin-like domain-containing protein [Balneolales bacterium]
MKKKLVIVSLIVIISLGGCGIIGSSDDEPDEFNIELDKEVLTNNSSINITAHNPLNSNINLLISRTGDPHIEKQTHGEWGRIEEEPPSFSISSFTLEPGQQREREISYDYIALNSEITPGEYRVYYNYYIGDEELEILIGYSDSFMVE